MGNTTNLNLPYPEKSDVANIPEDIKNLAETIDAQFKDNYGGWTPTLTNSLEDASPTVTYSSQYGSYVKIPIKGSAKSIVFFDFSVKGIIKAITGNNYAAIGGLPFERDLTFGLGGCTFYEFYKGIDDTHLLPIGKFVSNNGNKIGIYSGNADARGGKVETWVVNTTAFSIRGYGWYITDEANETSVVS